MMLLKSRHRQTGRIIMKFTMQLIAVMFASLFRAIDLPAWQWGLSLLSWVPENAFMWPSRLPIQYHRNTL
jgi:hypothetical protein